MSDPYQFPVVIGEDEMRNQNHPPWGAMAELDSWLDANLCRFLFPLDEIRSNAKEYSYADCGAPSVAGIYFLQWDGDIVYVGKASNIATRLRAHWADGKLWTHYWCFSGVPEYILENVEYMYIQWLNPIMNDHCRGWTEIGSRLIQDLEPYEPFVGAVMSDGTTMGLTQSRRKKS